MSKTSSSKSYSSGFKENKPIGSGGFSTVFEAEDLSNKTICAIKKIPFNDEDRPKTLREIKILSTLNDDHIAKCYSSWIEPNYYIGSKKEDNGDKLYDPLKTHLLHIQMELYPANLLTIIKGFHYSEKNTITLEQYSICCKLLIQVLKGVQYLHEQNIIHRDLKPDNILISITDDQYCIKIADFGLSTYHKFVDESKTKYVGTPSYKAPEVDFSTDYTTKVDIYSLGRIILHLFNMDLNNDCKEVLEKQLGISYKNLISITLNCFNAISSQRPECNEILNKQNLWCLDNTGHSYLNEIKTLIKNQFETKNTESKDIITLQITKNISITAASIENKNEQDIEFTTFIDSLLWSTFYEIKKISDTKKSDKESDFEKYYLKYAQYYEENAKKFFPYHESYRNIFNASISGAIFFQNGRFKNEFKCDTDYDMVKIGYGSYGDVYKVKHKIDEQYYAIKKQQKVLTDEFKIDNGNKLLRELKVNATIKFDYLLHYKSFWFELSGRLATLYIQMELCAMDLKSVVNLTQKLNPNLIHMFVISNIFKEILIGVNYLHCFQPQIIHRDLKPANILVTNGENGRFIKIADFGFAVFHEFPDMSHSKDMGTADYTAPEVKSGHYDTSADIFSLGMVLAKISNFLQKRDTKENVKFLFDSKMSYINQLQSKMIDHTAKNRPTCDQILGDKNWLLTETEAINIDEFKEIMKNSINVFDIKNTFFEYYTYEKLKSSYASLQINQKGNTIFTKLFQNLKL